jgi:hypothetical protein
MSPLEVNLIKKNAVIKKNVCAWPNYEIPYLSNERKKNSECLYSRSFLQITVIGILFQL